MTERCRRCGGPLTFLDREEGLCAENGCFTVFLHTLMARQPEPPHGLPPATKRDAAWWAFAYQRVAKEGGTL